MKKISLLIIISILISPVVYINIDIVLAASNTYYVDNAGSNSNDGLSPSTPWKTIGKVNTAMTDGTIKIGDNIYFKRGGTFTDASIIVRIDGTSSDWLVIGAYGTGANPRIDGTTYGVSLRTVQVDYVRIENLTLSNQSGYGITSENFNNTHIYIFNVTVENNGDNGIYIDQTYYPTVENCTVHDIHTGGIVFYGTTTHRVSYGKILNCTVYNCGLVTASDGIIIHSGDYAGEPYGKNFLVKGCVSYSNSEQGYDFYGERAAGGNGGNICMKDCISHNNLLGGIDLGAYCNNVTIDNFLSYDETGYFGIAPGDGMNELIIRNSVLYNEYRYSLVTYSEYYEDYIENITIYNNDFIPDNINLGSALVGFTAFDKNIIFKNNILLSLDTAAPSQFIRYNATGPNTPATTNSVYTNNIYWDVSGAVGNQWYYGGSSHVWTAWTGLPETVGELRDNPELADPVNHNFRLNRTSPCIDAGANLTQTNGGSTGTVITVDDASYFMDGYGMTTGDVIFVGNDENLLILEVVYSTNTIIVNRSITWSDNDPVGLTFSGVAPDIGAYEFSSTENNSLPKITQIICTTSNPLDTDPLFGWINISCVVTDETAVNTVQLCIKNHNGIWNNITMNQRSISNYYYQSSNAFSQPGNYSYIIRAVDINNNVNLSDDYKFSMPPNWDMNCDGEGSILDLVMVSNHYDELSPLGWIREDTNNDGNITILDLAFVSNHYGTKWFT